MTPSLYRAIGLMSGTSLDGIDAALIETDGYDAVRPVGYVFLEYEPEFRERLRACFGNRKGANDLDVAVVERELTERHAYAVQELLNALGLTPNDIGLIGFHGQTICHEPAKRLTIQIGDGALLAELTGIPVVNDFRTADVQAGGQGAPLVPLYHRALVANQPKPIAIVNIGGVSNITWIGSDHDDDLLAFDMGPGNALIDDWMLRHTGQPYDDKGTLASQGRIDGNLIVKFLQHPYFRQKPPKSLDRGAFESFMPNHLNVADGATTLTMMTVLAISEGLDLINSMHNTSVGNEKVPLPLREGLGEGYVKETSSPSNAMELHFPRVYVTGGGRHNTTMLRWLVEKTERPVYRIEGLGWNGDAIEAEAFAYLAIRSRLGLPLSLPGTTGVPQAMTGGVFYEVTREDVRATQA